MKLSAVLYHQSNPDHPIQIDDLFNFASDHNLSLPLLLSAYLGRVEVTLKLLPGNAVEPPSHLRIYDRLNRETFEFLDRSELVRFCEERGLSRYIFLSCALGRRKDFLFFEKIEKPENIGVR